MNMDIFRKYGYLMALILVAVLTHLLWFDFSSIIFSWDAPLWTDILAKSFRPLGAGTYYSQNDFGVINVAVFSNLINAIWGLMQSYFVGLRLSLLIPTAFFSVLSPYFLIKFIIKDERIAFVCSLFFAFAVSLVYLELSHVPMALGFSLVPLLLLNFIKLIRDLSYKNLATFGLFFSIGIWYEIRMMYALLFILLFYWLFFGYWRDFWKNKRKYMILVGVIFLLNLFWILPSFLGVSDSLGVTASRGATDTGSGILNSMTNYNDKWSGGLVTQSFSSAEVPWWAWVGPSLAFGILYYFGKIRKREDRKNIFFFATVTLIGILLAKQGDPPFQGVFDWMYDNFPGFSVYRVGARFLFVVALGYLGLLAYAIKYLIIENRKMHAYAKNVALILLSLVFLWNAKPLVTGEAGNLFVNRVEPSEYIILNKFLSSQEGFFRTAWFPRPSVWGYFSNEKPRVNMRSVAKKELKTFYDLDQSEDFNIFYPFEMSYGDELADFSGIKYFIIPMIDDQDEMLYVEGKKYRDKFVRGIKKIDFLEKVNMNGLEDIVVYENKDIKPYIFPLNSISKDSKGDDLPRIEFDLVSPTTKNIRVYEAKTPFYLVMSEKYDLEWKLIKGKEGFWNLINPWNTNKIISKEEHQNFLGFLNAWYVDPERVCDDAKCVKNSDGSLNMNLTVQFWPQKWYYLGILISFSTLILILGFLIFIRFKK